LRLERNYGEAVRLLQARLGQFHFASPLYKAQDQAALALTQRLAGDTARAKVTAEQARNTLEQLYRDQPDNAVIAASLSLAYAAVGEKDSALKTGERAVMLMRRPNAVFGPTLEENLAFIQTIFGENTRAISTLTQLLQTPYQSWLYEPTPITPALLRLDPLWDLCAPIQLSKNSVRKSSREPARFRSTVDSNGRTIWIADAHRDDRKRFVVRADEKLTTFLELESTVCGAERPGDCGGREIKFDKLSRIGQRRGP
jgi:tetratricopeptide (TPR) repeat protein